MDFSKVTVSHRYFMPETPHKDVGNPHKWWVRYQISETQFRELGTVEMIVDHDTPSSLGIGYRAVIAENRGVDYGPYNPMDEMMGLGAIDLAEALKFIMDYYATRQVRGITAQVAENNRHLIGVLHHKVIAKHSLRLVMAALEMGKTDANEDMTYPERMDRQYKALEELKVSLTSLCQLDR